MTRDTKNDSEGTRFANRPNRIRPIAYRDPAEKLRSIMNGLAESVLQASEEELAEELKEQGLAEGGGRKNVVRQLLNAAQVRTDGSGRNPPDCDADDTTRRSLPSKPSTTDLPIV